MEPEQPEQPEQQSPVDIPANINKLLASVQKQMVTIAEIERGGRQMFNSRVDYDKHQGEEGSSIVNMDTMRDHAEQ